LAAARHRTVDLPHQQLILPPRRAKTPRMSAIIRSKGTDSDV